MAVNNDEEITLLICRYVSASWIRIYWSMDAVTINGNVGCVSIERMLPMTPLYLWTMADDDKRLISNWAISPWVLPTMKCLNLRRHLLIKKTVKPWTMNSYWLFDERSRASDMIGHCSNWISCTGRRAPDWGSYRRIFDENENDFISN